VLVEFPVVFKYKAPCAALIPGAPEPTKTPRLATLDNVNATLPAPFAPGEVCEYAITALVELTFGKYYLIEQY
jgi:hypothetical protein